MAVYAVILFACAGLFCWLGMAIYRGRMELIHAYHRTRVTDPAAYGRAFAKPLLLIAGAMLLSGIAALLTDSFLPMVILLAGLAAGIGGILAVQAKYNKGLF